MFYDRNNIIYDICWETNEFGKISCQNCRTRLPYENNWTNQFNQIHDNILTRITNRTGDKKFLFESSKKKYLKEKEMTLNFYTKGEGEN